MTKDQGPRTKDQGPRTKDQGPRKRCDNEWPSAEIVLGHWPSVIGHSFSSSAPRPLPWRQECGLVPVLAKRHDQVAVARVFGRLLDVGVGAGLVGLDDV